MSGLETHIETKAQTGEQCPALSLIGDTWTKLQGSLWDKTATDARAQDGQQEGPPAPTEQQIRTMHERAAAGALNDTAGVMCVRALQANGVRGLTDLRNDMNTQLQQANSEYRARVGRVDGPNGTINLYLILQRNNENLNDMVRDAHQNGANSQYRGRFIHLELTPEAPPRPDA